jgi:hypothetical protein
VTRQLIAVEVEIDPCRRTSALAAAEQLDIEAARLVEVGDEKRVMKGAKAHLARRYAISMAERRPMTMMDA